MKENTWHNIILDFFANSVAKSSLYKSRVYIRDKQSELKSITDDKKKDKLIQLIEKRQIQFAEEKATAPKTEINEWITDTASKNIAIGKRIIKVTHTSKFTHSSANNDGLIIDFAIDTNQPYLCSQSMKSLTYDVAHNNGALVTISRFLALTRDNQSILDSILNDDFIFLEGFYHNEEQLELWKNGFSEIVEERNIQSCDKLKSLYFPINKDNSQYHLLTPLYATSLSQQIFEDRIKSKYSKRSDKFFLERNERVDFVSMAYINFGGEHAKNVSVLNANRGGKGYVFSCQAPVWKAQDNAYQKQVKIFDNGIIRYRAKEAIEFLTEYILRFQKLEVSFAKPTRKVWLEQWVHEVLQVTTDYADEIIFSNSPNWTNTLTNKFNQTYQYWLDPYNTNDNFQQNRADIDWQATISQDFAKWLAVVINHHAEKKNKRFNNTAWFQSLFMELASEALRLHESQINSLQFDYVNEELS